MISQGLLNLVVGAGVSLLLSVAISANAANNTSAPQPLDAPSCDSLPACLKVFEDPGIVDPSQAKFFLDEQADQATIASVARILHEHNDRLRDRAVWFLHTGPRHWPTELEDWKADVMLNGDDAHELSGMGNEVAYRALLDLAQKDIADAENIGLQLRRVDTGRRWLDLGVSLIECSDPCKYPRRDALLHGMFSHFAVGDDVASVRKRLLAEMANRRKPDAARQRAFVAYHDSLTAFDTLDLPTLRSVFAKASPQLHRSMSTEYPRELGGARELIPSLVNDLKRDPLPAIEILWRIGPDAREAAPAVERLLASDDANLRMEALGLLRAIDTRAWRKHLARAAADPDPLVAMQATIEASEDGSDAFASAREAAQSHWFPPVRNAVSRLKLRPRHGLSTPGVDDVRGLFHALPPTCPPMRTAPATLSGLPLLPDGHDNARRAFVATDLPYPTVALQIATGWLVGTDDGEFGGSLYFWSPGKDDQVIGHSGSAVRAMFRWREGTNAVIERWGLPELDRLNPNGNGFKAIATTHFVTPVQAVYGDSSRLVVLLQRFGAADVTDARRPRWIGCDGSR